MRLVHKALPGVGFRLEMILDFARPERVRVGTIGERMGLSQQAKQGVYSKLPEHGTYATFTKLNKVPCIHAPAPLHSIGKNMHGARHKFIGIIKFSIKLELIQYHDKKIKIVYNVKSNSCVLIACKYICEPLQS